MTGSMGKVTLERTLVGGLILLLGLSIVVYVARPISILFSHVSEDYNEGWNAYHTFHLMSGMALYPPISPLM